MNLHQQGKLKPAIYTVIILMGAWLILPHGMNYFFDSSHTLSNCKLRRQTRSTVSLAGKPRS